MMILYFRSKFRSRTKERKGEIGVGMYVKTTKDILADSLRELAAKKPISKITVTSIAENCGLTTPTFYNHFTDKYNLIAWIYRTDLERIVRRTAERGRGWRILCEEWLSYMAQNRDFLVNAIRHTRGQDAFAVLLSTSLFELISAELKQGGCELSAEFIDIARVYCYGSTSFVCKWLFDNMPAPRDKVCELLMLALPEPLKPFL